MNASTYVVEGRRFDANRPALPLAFAQHIADDTRRVVVVYLQAPGGPKMEKERVKPTWKPGDKL